MTKTNRIGSITLAVFAGTIGLTLAATSLAHNIEGVLPRLSALPGTFHYYNQIMIEGGATVGLNMVALFGFTFATLMTVRGSFGKAIGLSLVAILAMLWSGTTQLGVIAEKTFSVSGSKSSAMALYQRALTDEAAIIAAMPISHKFMGQAQQDVRTALAALKSHHYGRRTAWQTTNSCTGDITAPASVALCGAYNRAVRALQTSKYAADLDQRRVAVNVIIAKGQPQTIDAGPELIASASMGFLSVKNVQVILVFLRSFGIDLAAGLFLAAAFAMWPLSNGASVAHQQPRINPAPNKNGNGGQRVQSWQQSQRVIEQLKQPVHSVQTDAHYASATKHVLLALEQLSENGDFKTTYRELSGISGVAVGGMNEALETLAAKGLIERYSSKGRGTVGRIPALSMEYAS